MPRKREQLSIEEVRASFADQQRVLDVKRFAEIFGVSPNTVRDWYARGRFGPSARKLGKHIRIFRDRAIVELFKEPDR